MHSRMDRRTLAVLAGICGFVIIAALAPTAGSAARKKTPAAMLDEGRQTFRFDTFGDEDFWGGQLRLHEAIEGSALGGVGPGVSPRSALGLGLKVDVDALPPDLVNRLRRNAVDLDNPATTLALMKLNAVVGVTGFFNSNGSLRTMGIQCALCHSTVDDSLSPGIGHRLDGWANRDLNVGAIIASAPDLAPLVDLLQVPLETVRKVLLSWGPGKFDAELILDGAAFQPGGRSAAALIPPAFGLAGVNLHTWTGWGSIPYWNAFVAVLEMHGKGRFVDSRLNDATRFPVAARAGFANVEIDPRNDRVTSKLPALHAYQISLQAPEIDPKLVDQAAAARGQKLFTGKARCNNCHTGPLLTEPGWNAHKPAEICIDAFQANRSPDGIYRTAPLGGLFSHQKGGFYHDGRFATLADVVGHYNACLDLGLTDLETKDLIQYLLTL